jgi:predicted TIM-barrel fold metal-dependent hydrolase
MDMTRRSLIGAALPAALLTTAGWAASRRVPAGPGPVIDLHSHWFSPSAVATLSARSFGPRIADGPDGQRVLHRTVPGQATPPFALGRQWFDIEARLAHLEQVGVVHQLLSWPTTMGIDPALSAAESTPMWKAYNDELAAVVRAAPKRLSGVAVLSTSDIAWSVKELARAHGDLGLIGAVLPVNGFASLEAAQHFAPVFEQAQRLKSHIFLHTGFAHQSIPGQPPVDLHADTIGVRSAFDTATQFASSAITLAYTDFLDAYPDVTVQIAMLGGSGISALIAEAVALPGRSAEPLKTRFDRLWLDTGAAGQGPTAIAAAARVLGASRIVFGSDYAPSASIAPVIANVRAAGLPIESERRILFENARALLARHGVAIDGARAGLL